jgi:hypothetical protein
VLNGQFLLSNLSIFGKIWQGKGFRRRKVDSNKKTGCAGYAALRDFMVEIINVDASHKASNDPRRRKNVMVKDEEIGDERLKG